MRGPKNILRTAAEFALEHRRDCSVYCGSFTEVAATLYAFGMATTSAAARAFCKDATALPAVKRLAAAADPAALAALAAPSRYGRGLVLAPDDADALKASVGRVFADIAERYYLDPSVEPEVRAGGDAIRITIPVEKLR